LLATAQRVGWRGGEVEARVRSSAACVTYSLATASPAAAADAVTPPPPLLLGPGDTVRARLAASGWHGRWQLLPWSAPRVDTASLPFEATLGFEPREDLVRLDVDPTPRPLALATVGAIEYQPVGWALWLSVVLPIVGIVALVYCWLRPARLQGQLWDYGAGTPRLDLGALNRRRYTLVEGAHRLHFTAVKCHPLGSGIETWVELEPDDPATTIEVKADGAIQLGSTGAPARLDAESRFSIAVDGAPTPFAWTPGGPPLPMPSASPALPLTKG
jgi:hypothetical protein